MIRITSAKDGFRRAGVTHSRLATEYPDDFFTADQLKALKSEPMIVVETIEGSPAKMSANAVNAAKDQLRRDLDRTMTVEQLTEELTKMAVEIPKGSKKPDLIELIIANTTEPPEEK